MAAQTAIYAQHATLSSTTADSVTFSGTGSTICVTNRDTTNTLYFTVNSTATVVTAVAAADESFVVLPLQSKTINAKGTTVVSVVGNGGGYSVELW
jgi:hypothetical protein